MLKPQESRNTIVVSVFIADSSRMGCQLMAAALARSRGKLAVVGYATSSNELRYGLGRDDVHVAVLGTQFKEGARAGFGLAREIRVSHPKTSVIMMLDSMERETVVESFRAGASGVFSRDEPFELLLKCIQAVHGGQVWAGSRELRFLIDVFAQSAPVHTASKLPDCLTKREKGVVNLVAEGLTNRDISRQLNLSEHTVRNYLFKIYNKMGTSNRLELALSALDRRGEPTQVNVDSQERAS